MSAVRRKDDLRRRLGDRDPGGDAGQPVIGDAEALKRHRQVALRRRGMRRPAAAAAVRRRGRTWRIPRTGSAPPRHSRQARAPTRNRRGPPRRPARSDRRSRSTTRPGSRRRCRSCRRCCVGWRLPGGRTPVRMSVICQAAGPSRSAPSDERLECSLRSVAQPLGAAAIGKAGVELDEIAQGQADASEADGEAGRFVGRQARRDAGGAEAGDQPRRPDRVEQPNRRAHSATTAAPGER